jgi:hypothetical protein
MANIPDSEIHSHLKTYPGAGKTGAGQNADPRASSTSPVKTSGHDKTKGHGIHFDPIPVVGPKAVDAAKIAARGGDVQDTIAHRVKGSPVAAHAGMRSRVGEGGTVPTKTDRGPQARHPKK